MPPDKITKAEFVKRIKNKYPVYKDMPDSELFDKIIAKYPAYKDQLSDMADISVEKKSPNGNGSSVGQNGASIFDNPVLNPSLSKEPEVLPQPSVQPIAKKSPIDILREDYSANKVDIDKSLTSTVGDNPEFGQYVQGDGLFKSIVDPVNPDKTLLTKYSNKRKKDLDNEFEVRKQQLDIKYPQPVSQAASVMALPITPARSDNYYQELNDLNDEIDTKKKSINDAIWEIAAEKKINAEFKKVAQPKFDKKEIGRYMRSAVGDPTLAREERLERKGIPLSPSEKYYNDKIGYIAMASVLKKMKDNGVDILNDPAAKKLYDNVKDGKNKLLTDHKDFARQQAGKLISDEISKDKNWFQLMTGAYTINDDDIKKYAKKLNIPDEVSNLVTEKDIQTSNVFGEFLNELAARPGANIGTFIGRPFRREVLGQDPDAIDYHYEQLNKKYTTALAESQSAQAVFANPTEIQSDPTQENFLEDQRNSRQGKFNWSIPAIANSVANGAGQMLQYGLGATGVAGGLTGVNRLLGVASNVDRAKDIGLVTYGFLNSYEGGYQRARELIGDDPGKETERNVIGALWAGIQAGSELIFKDYKVTDKLFSVKNAGSRQLLELLAKSKTEDLAKVLTSGTAKKSLTQAIKEGVVKTSKGTLQEIGEEEAANIGDVAIAMVANKKSLEDRDIPEEFLQTAITTAIASILPIGAAEMRQTSHTSGINKSMVHDVGIDPATYIAHINSEAEDGKISRPFANKKISIVNTMADIVQRAVPNTSPINNKPLSEKDKIDYSYNLLHTQFLNDQLEIEKKTDEVQAKITEKKLGVLAAERQGILQNADGVEKNFDGKPIYDRDVIPELTDEEKGALVQTAIDNAEDVKIKVWSEALKSGDAGTANDILKEVSDQWHDEGTRDATERNFGLPIVEVAKKLFPQESVKTLLPEEKKTDYTGKDNNFLANKEEGFFTPQERERYNELMKKPETEGEAAQMVADKKEEIKKFAPQPTVQEVKAEEVKPEVVKPEAPAGTYRTKEEADKILAVKVPFVKNFNQEVEYHDIVTGETKTAKTYQAKEEMVKRYNSLQSLIVNCLT